MHFPTATYRAASPGTQAVVSPRPPSSGPTPQNLMEKLRQGRMPPPLFYPLAFQALALVSEPEYVQLLQAYINGASRSATLEERAELQSKLSLRRFAINFEAPTAEPPWAARPATAAAAASPLASASAAAPVQPLPLPLPTRDFVGTIRSLQTQFGFDAAKLANLARAIKASLDRDASAPDTAAAVAAYERDYSHCLGGSIADAANRGKFLMLAMAIDNFRPEPVVAATAAALPAPAAGVAAPGAQAATAAALRHQAASNAPAEVTQVVGAFRQVLAESQSAGASGNPDKQHSLPLQSPADAARLLFRSLAKAAVPSGHIATVHSLPPLERLVPFIDASIDQLLSQGHVSQGDAAALRAEAPRVRTAIRLMREFPSAPLTYPFLIQTLSLSPQSRSPLAQAKAEDLTRLTHPLNHWVEYCSYATFHNEGHFARMVQVIDRAHQVGLIGRAQREVILNGCRQHAEFYKNWQGGMGFLEHFT